MNVDKVRCSRCGCMMTHHVEIQQAGPRLRGCQTCSCTEYEPPLAPPSDAAVLDTTRHEIERAVRNMAHRPKDIQWESFRRKMAERDPDTYSGEAYRWAHEERVVIKHPDGDDIALAFEAGREWERGRGAR